MIQDAFFQSCWCTSGLCHSEVVLRPMWRPWKWAAWAKENFCSPPPPPPKGPNSGEWRSRGRVGKQLQQWTQGLYPQGSYKLIFFLKRTHFPPPSLSKYKGRNVAPEDQDSILDPSLIMDKSSTHLNFRIFSFPCKTEYINFGHAFYTKVI